MLARSGKSKCRSVPCKLTKHSFSYKFLFRQYALLTLQAPQELVRAGLISVSIGFFVTINTRDCALVRTQEQR